MAKCPGFMNVFRVLFFFFFPKKRGGGQVVYDLALSSLLYHFYLRPCLQRNHKFQTLFWPFCVIGVT